MRERARSETLPIPVIYKQECSSVTESMQIENPQSHRPILPSFYEVRGTLYNERKKNFPPLPKSFDEIEIPPNLSKTISGREFLSYQDPEKGILIFATSENLQILANLETYYMDGTFDVCPVLFVQLFTIHGFVNEKQIPLVYALLPNKKTETYITIFRILRDKAGEENLILNPKVSSD